MIPKPLTEINWSDLEALRDSGREEDDTIEYKGSFTGGSDFLAFSDNERRKAVSSLAKEAIAFMNGRGGDILIGAKEARNDHPRIEELVLLPHVDSTVDRLEQALTSTIEPMQSALQIRAVKRSAEDGDGVIVLRARASLRAPHRHVSDRECYVRRGRSSVRMPMDEIQDVTLNRAMQRSAHNSALDKQFSDMLDGKVGLRQLRTDRVHFRLVYMPYNIDEIELDTQLLDRFGGNDPRLTNRHGEFQNNVAFRSLAPPWKPELRGRKMEGYFEDGDAQMYCRKSLKKNVTMLFDYAESFSFENQTIDTQGAYYSWILGFFANAFYSVRSVLLGNSSHFSGTLRVAGYFGVNQHIVDGARHFERGYPLPLGFVPLPDFEIEGVDSLDSAFSQVQIDINSLAGLECPDPYPLPNTP